LEQIKNDSKCKKKDTVSAWKQLIEKERGTITREVTLYIKERNEDNVDLLNNAFKLCGIFNEDKIIEFIRDNFNKMVDINFVEMLTTFIVEAKKVKMLNRASSATLLERAYIAMFQL
jgi:hypothetical protein